MSTGFSEISPEEITDNAFKLVGKDWMLVTAGQADKFNSLTASWGGLGVLWQKPVATIYIRPQRYTREFIERETYFTLSFFDEAYRNVLSVFGAASGREIDKVKATGVTPVTDNTGAVYYGEARLVLVLKKVYAQSIDPTNAMNIDLSTIYPDKDYHRIFIGEIVKVLRKG